MSAADRVDFKMDVVEQDVAVSKLVGTTTAAFVRTAGKEKGQELLVRDSSITMSARDFQTFTAALNGAFAANQALQIAMSQVREICVLDEFSLEQNLHDRQVFASGIADIDE